MLWRMMLALVALCILCCGVCAYSCSSPSDCSLTGECVEGVCECDVGWKGDDCGALNLAPVRRGSGYNRTSEGTSSWGGTIVRGNSSSHFHLVAAEFTGGCGLDYWSPMSRIIRAESASGAEGPYTFVQEIAGTFAHNPTVVFDRAAQLFLLFHIGCPYAQPTSCQQGKISCDAGNNNNGESGITLRTASTIDSANWSVVGQVFSTIGSSSWDNDTTNPSPFVLPSGEVVLAYRGCPYNCGGAEQISVALGPTFRGPFKRLLANPLFPNPNEDPFIWQDKRGNWHLLMHSLEPHGGFGDGPYVGRHAFSSSLTSNWTFNSRTLAYNTTVIYTDGTQTDLYRRERPQVFFSDDGLMTPLFLTNGVQEKHSPMSYTLVQPFNTARHHLQDIVKKQPQSQ